MFSHTPNACKSYSYTLRLRHIAYSIELYPRDVTVNTHIKYFNRIMYKILITINKPYHFITFKTKYNIALVKPNSWNFNHMYNRN